MIKVSNLVKTYGDIQALNSLSLEIKKNQIFGLLGVNGAGKTTLLSALNGLLKVDSGTINIFGLDVNKDQKEIRSISSIIPQHLAFYDKLTVKENLDFFASMQRATAKSKNESIEINSLGNLLNQTSGTLSGGQKRRLNIAIGLLNSPQIIYFDEPTVGVDAKSRNEILDSIKIYRDLGVTVIYTSHYMLEIERICDEVAILAEGKLVKQESLTNLLSNQTSDLVMIDCVHIYDNQLDNATIVDPTMIETTQKNLHQVLKELDEKNVAVKQVRFGTTNLERYFLDVADQVSLND